MSLTSASTPTYRAGWAKASSLASGAAVVRHQHQQTRGFRFGRPGSSYFDADTQDVCQRQRRIRYKYFQTLNRRLSWEQHPLAEDTKTTLKRMSKDYWYPVEQHNSARRHADEEIAANTINNPTGIRPGQNIEDVERAPLEDLLFGDAKGQTKTKAEASFEKSKRNRGNKNKNKSVKAESDYVIDPITNRKILQSATLGLDSKTPSSSPYTSQFTNLSPPELDASNPIFYDGPPPEAELKFYSQVKIDDAPWNPIDPASAMTLSDVLLKDTSAPDLLNTLSSNQAQVSWHPNTGIAATTAAVPPLGSQPQPVVPEATETFKPQAQQESTSGELSKYGPVRASEPDGKYKNNTEPVASQSELGKYDAVRSHEPDGKYKQVSEENVNKVELGQYGAVRSHEPDGKYKRQKEFTNTSEYDPAELAQYDAVRAHEPDGKYKKEKTFTNTQEYDPAELAEYVPVRSHEPDGMYKKEKTVNNYDEYDPEELAKYDAVRAHEPDGMYKKEKEFTNTSEYDPEELALYEDGVRAHEPDGMYKKEKEFTNYSEYDPAELASYGAFRAHEPDGMYKKEKSYTNYSEYEDLDTYDKPFLSHEPDGKYAAEMARAQPARSEPKVLKELRERQQQPASDAAWDAHCQTNAAEEAKVAEELSQYGAFRSHEPDGKYAAAAQGQKPAYDAAADEENALEAFTYEDAQTTTSASTQTTSEPTLYKILAFNPDTQTVEAADTTSTVLPSTSATGSPTSSPADVIPRMTNISKFLPYFARLESEGFEIAAGSGDVLVFRKVRDAVTPEPSITATGTTGSARQAVAANGAPLNPIDMTGGSRRDYHHVAAGRFASPTGFVNYNLPSAAGAVNQAKVHYEQPASAFEGQQEHHQQQQEQKQGKKKGSFPKRAVMGAAWVVGGAYSVGVVREYFRTGGVDGKGHKGL
ncbi:hypothetical protein B0T20DRAFT_350597 [Sordaria brevicollis]|uniref:Serine-threonine rich protein n=1 Tax=Sordaria brevicollis TaxID=83679 RepID=A0AAE0UDB3_SORBR|nr:hypothetical protein B0T20DRAFT_350597 [Sordaria brevicollis]